MRRLTTAAAAALVFAWGVGRMSPAQEAAPARVPAKAQAKSATVADRIREEGLKRSQVMKTVGYLTDVIGPRLTGSPQMKRANEWTRDTMATWGLENAHLESWGTFGRGWSLVRFSAQIVQPQCIPLIAYPRAWSPGLEHPLEAEVVYYNPKSTAELSTFEGKLRGKVVLMGDVRELPAWFSPPGNRLTDTQLLDLANATPPEPRLDRFFAALAGVRGRGPRPGGGPRGDVPSPMQFLRARGELLAKEEPALIMQPSGRGDGGTLFIDAASVSPGMPRGGVGGPRIWDKDPGKVIPQVVLTIEHFNRLVRMLEQGETLRMAVDLAVQFHEEDLNGYNTIAEIVGTDRKDELVMLGGHLDSWHSGTGATDNAAGVAVAMEAVRILKALNLRPRRTVRVALWSGEEQGLLGSRAYVKEHFGAIEPDPLSVEVARWVGGQPRLTLRHGPEYNRLSVYFNLDNGTGKIRGIHMEGNEAVRPIFRKWFDSFRDLGASTLSASRTGGTDHMSFDAIGLPAFQFIQDPIEYSSRTHHSNQDVYERLQAEDLKQASVIMATLVYNAATADDLLPRKPEPGRGGSEVRVAE